ncbi:MAG: hemolysin family protein [Candidatus Brocadiia bacterium]
MMLPQLGVLAVLLALSAFFSSSETALFSLSRVQVQRLRLSGGRSGRAVARLLALPRRLLITILVGNMVVNVAASSVVAATATALLGSKGVGVAIGLTTLLLLLFGEVTPKTFAVRHAEGLSRAVALPLLWFCQAILPLRVVLRHITNGVLFLLRQGHIQSARLLTQHEFGAALAVGEEEGVIDEHEREMVEHIFEFGQMDAREVMVPRTEMTCVSEQATLAQAVELARRSRHSRLPVHSGDIDRIWGLFDVKDVPAWRGRDVLGLSIRQFADRARPAAQAPRRPVVRPAFLVPETRHVGDLLRDMRDSGAHMAILVDEHGGTAGLVTLRQLVDELVGDVLARGRSGEPLYRRTDGRVQVLGEARIRDVNSDLGLDLPLGRADTIGGYVLGLFGDLPRAGEQATDGRYRFRVLRLRGRRIGAVEVAPRDPRDPAWQRVAGGPGAGPGDEEEPRC